jgi:hypothetical protein
MSNLTDFFPSGGGGGLTPKFEEFNSSGTFTPTQALIDAGGYIELFLVAGGGGGSSQEQNNTAGSGGEVLIKKMYLTSVNSISITIGSGGLKANQGSNGGNSVFLGSQAGGVDITSKGGRGGGDQTQIANMISTTSPSWSTGSSSTFNYSAGNGVFGYGAGGGTQGARGGGAVNVSALIPNTGQGGTTGNGTSVSSDGSSGYCLIKWYE